MTVVLSEKHAAACRAPSASKAGPCAFCGKQFHYPFLWWQTYRQHYKNKWMDGNPIAICAACCKELRTGFVADLIQVNAIRELRQVYSSSDVTFDRLHTDHQKSQAEIRCEEPLAFDVDISTDQT